MTIRLGTRGSDLALAQARWTAAALEAMGETVETVVISTAGDRSHAPSFGSIGPQGVFVTEIEQSLVAGAIDCAVHSCKDLPTKSPEGLVVAAVPPRVDAADYLLVRADAFDASAAGGLPLGPGAVVGTSSARRQRWLELLRDDIEVAPLRGNVPTRIRRLAEGSYRAIVLAHAGIERLDASDPAFAATLDAIRLWRLDPAVFVPAPAQGALALQCRIDDARSCELLARLDDSASRLAVTAERLLLTHAEGGCDAAFGAHCEARDGAFVLTAMAEIDGTIRRAQTPGDDAATLAETAWAALKADRNAEP